MKIMCTCTDFSATKKQIVTNCSIDFYIDNLDLSLTTAKKIRYGVSGVKQTATCSQNDDACHFGRERRHKPCNQGAYQNARSRLRTSIAHFGHCDRAVD